MGNLLMRRSLLVAASGSEETWDFEWDYTMGKLEEQTGWAVDKRNTASSSIISDGEKFLAPTNSYIQPYVINGGARGELRCFTSGYGVLEAVCYGVFNSTSQNLRITGAIDSSKRITLYQCGGKWRLMDGSTPPTGTVIATATNNTLYKVKIVMKNTAADVYINNTLVLENQNLTATKFGTNNGVMYQNGGSGYYGVVQSFKLRIGRI